MLAHTGINWGNHFMFGGFMWVFWIVVIIGLVFLIKWIVQQGNTPETRAGGTPLEILKKRYARGEISKEEFEQRKKDLLE
jgi:putative membrane protein